MARRCQLSGELELQVKMAQTPQKGVRFDWQEILSQTQATVPGAESTGAG